MARSSMQHELDTHISCFSYLFLSLSISIDCDGISQNAKRLVIIFFVHAIEIYKTTFYAELENQTIN